MKQKQSYQINQKQLQRLALTQSMKQAILVLQTNLLDLTDYVQDLSMANPLFDVNPTISKQEVEISTTLENRSIDRQTIYDYLLEQVHLTMRQTPLKDVVIKLIDCLDEHGYLLLSDQELLKDLEINRVQLMDAKELLYNLDPPGVGAQSLHECLMLQLEFKKATKNSTLALQMLEYCYDELLNHSWLKIAQKLQKSRTEIDTAFKLIQTLSPYPYVSDYGKSNYIIPELIVKNNNGHLSLEVTKYGYPNLVFAEETYDELKKNTDLEVKAYIKNKYQEYQALKTNLDHRIQTIAMIGRCIVQAQSSFLLGETQELRPLLLRDVAQKLGISISTVSRTINGKYLQTDTGIFELKFFFTKRSNGNANQSVDQVKRRISDLIEQENIQHPLSDQKIAELLSKKGIKIARRTVSKYREELGIMSSSKRKI